MPRVESAVGPGARLERLEKFGRDVRRLRPNLVVSAVGAAEQRRWPGAASRLPAAEIRLADLRERCVMTT